MPAPAVIKAFGPNGTNYPDDTAYVWDDGGYAVEVDCSWAAIADGIRTAATVADTRVLVRPGMLPGFGAASGSPAALSNLLTDRPNRDRVLVTPRDGWGTVTLGANARLHRVFSCSFLGFDVGQNDLALTGCTNTAWAWSRMQAWRNNGLAGQITERCQMIECVIPWSKVGELDAAGFGAGYVPNLGQQATGSGALIRCDVFGGYHAPQYRPPGSKAHNDSMQLYGSAIYNNFRFRNFASFGTNNCGLQIGKDQFLPLTNVNPAVGPDEQYLRLDHCFITDGRTSARTRYPLPPGAEPLPATGGDAINDIGRIGMLNANDSYIAGNLYGRGVWNEVINSVTLNARPSKLGDGWRADKSVVLIGADDVDDLGVPLITDEYLARIWSRPVPPVDTALSLAVLDMEQAHADLAARQGQLGLDVAAQETAWRAFRSAVVLR